MGDFLGIDDIELHFLDFLHVEVDLDIGIVLDIIFVSVEEYLGGRVGLARFGTARTVTDGVHPLVGQRFRIRALDAPVADALRVEDSQVGLASPDGEFAIGSEPVSEVVGSTGDPLQVIRVVFIRDTEHDGVVGLRRGHGVGVSLGEVTHAFIELFLGETKEIADFLTGERDILNGIIGGERVGLVYVDDPGLLLVPRVGIIRSLLFIIIVDGDDVLGFVAGRDGDRGGCKQPKDSFHRMGFVLFVCIRFILRSPRPPWRRRSRSSA